MAEQQVPGIKRTNLQRHDLSVPGREVVQLRVDIDPSAPLLKGTHPGEEIIYVLEGAVEYQIEDKPTKVYNAGEALTVPAGVIHAVRNVGSGNAAELATYVVEKGKPLLTPAEERQPLHLPAQRQRQRRRTVPHRRPRRARRKEAPTTTDRPTE
jgi:quercetin dioxygenase-like cupin family protein